jgi:DNA-binding response OmpR family regulator
MDLSTRPRSAPAEVPHEAPASARNSDKSTGTQVLIVEDDSRCIRMATSILNKLNVAEVRAISSVAHALVHLRNVVDGQVEMPVLLILDLEFSMESGFEVLRYWKAQPELKNMRVIVWTVMGELQQKMSRLFGVDQVVDKHLGAGELEKAVRQALKTEKSS